MIDTERQLFPFCLVWTVIPCLSWLLPWIGHTGICDSQGIVYDFIGYTINTRRMSFGVPLKYVQLYPESQLEYDECVGKANRRFGEMGHNLCCNNCHHHVAYALEMLHYEGGGWGQFQVWWMCIRHSRYVSWGAVLKVYLPLIATLSLVLLLVALVK